jgi:hypothetical protein
MVNDFKFIDKYHSIISANYGKDITTLKQKSAYSLLYKYFKLNKNERRSMLYHQLFKSCVDQIFDEDIVEANDLSVKQTEQWVFMDSLRNRIDNVLKPNSVNSEKDTFIIALFFWRLRTNFTTTAIYILTEGCRRKHESYIFIFTAKQRSALLCAPR